MQLLEMRMENISTKYRLQIFGISIPESEAKKKWSPNHSMAIDNIAIKDLRDPDPQVLSAIHARYYPSLYRYARYKLDDAHAAEDAAGGGISALN